MTEAETEFCRGGLSAGTVVWGRPHQPQQPCLPGSAESAADIKLSWWRGVLGQQGLNTPVVAQWSTHPPARWKTGARTPAIANTASCPRQHAEDYCNFQKRFHTRGSIVVSISACHAEDPGSIPGRGVLFGSRVPALRRRTTSDTLQEVRIAVRAAGPE